MKRLPLFIICALASICIEVHAQQVSETMAQSFAAKVMNERNMGTVDVAKTVKAPRSKANAS